MKRGYGPLVVSGLLIVLGIGWLLNNLGVTPRIDWVYTLCLTALGLGVLFTGVDKVTFVVGLFLLAGAGLSVLRQTERLALNIEAPILVITLGVLLLAAYFLPLRMPAWLQAPERKG